MDLRAAYITVLLHGHADPELYNCSTKTIEEWYATGVQEPLIGAYYMVTGLFFEMLYISCLIVMFNHEMMRTNCFKLMFFLGIIDILSMSVNSVATGYFAITGAVYCTNPLTLLTLGALGCSCWCGACATCVVLAINRCTDMSNSRLSHFVASLFDQKRIYFTMFLIVLYICYIAFFTTPASFNSAYMSWFFNPMTGVESNYFTNMPHAINNCVVAVATTSLYTYLCITIWCQAGKLNFSGLRRQVFIQAGLICVLNAVAAYIYVYMQYFSISPWLIFVGQLAWQYSTGSVPLVYLIFNGSIRRGVIRLICPKALASKFPKSSAVLYTKSQRSNSRTNDNF